MVVKQPTRNAAVRVKVKCGSLVDHKVERHVGRRDAVDGYRIRPRAKPQHVFVVGRDRVHPTAGLERNLLHVVAPRESRARCRVELDLVRTPLATFGACEMGRKGMTSSETLIQDRRARRQQLRDALANSSV